MRGVPGSVDPTPATANTASSASNHHARPPSSPNVSPSSSNVCSKSSDSVDGSERRSSGYPCETNLGPVPSQIEVRNAISELQRAINEMCATNSEVMDSSRALLKFLGQNRLLDAYNLLQTDASVQKLVLSISSDIMVWNAILNNDAVRDLQRSLPYTGNKEKGMKYEQELNSTSLLIKWIFAFMKLKITELIEKLEIFVFQTIHSLSNNTKSTSNIDDMFEEKVRSSLLLSVVILLIVVITRSVES